MPDQNESAAILAQLAVVNQKLQTLHDDFREMKTLLKGDGESPGLQIRVDRLEQAAQKNNAFHMLWAGSLVSSAIAWTISKLS